MLPFRVVLALMLMGFSSAATCSNCYQHQGDLNGCNACDNCIWSNYDSACVPHDGPAQDYHHCSTYDPKCDAKQDECKSCSGDGICSWKKEVRSDTPSGYLWACYPSQMKRRNETTNATTCSNCYQHQGDLNGCNACDNCIWSNYDSACVPHDGPAQDYHHCSTYDPKCDAKQDECKSCSGDGICSWNKEVRSDTPSGYLWACYPSQMKRRNETTNATTCSNCYQHQGDLNGCNACDNCIWSNYDSACVAHDGPAQDYHHCSTYDPKCDAKQDECKGCSGDGICSWKKEVRSDTPSGYLWACYPSHGDKIQYLLV